MELKKILEKHAKWLRSEEGGERANLSGAYLSGADLSRANLSGAYLSGANLYGANLSRANLELDLLNKFLPICCPESDSFTAWKKVRGDYIVKLEVTETAMRSSAYGRKCRCSEAKVLAIENMDGSVANVEEVRSKHDNEFAYFATFFSLSHRENHINRFFFCVANKTTCINYYIFSLYVCGIMKYIKPTSRKLRHHSL